MGNSSTSEKADRAQISLRMIINHLKLRNLHALSGEVIPTKRKVGGETVHFIPSLYIPELKVPIELATDKDRDDDYLKMGMLPLVITESRMRFDSVEEFIDSFLDFHKKWSDNSI